MVDFYEKLINLCKQRGVSRSKMADDIGISRSAPQGWAEKGAIPRFDTIKKIADYFDVPVAYFSEGFNHTIHDNHGIIGNTHAPVTINGAADHTLGDIERELLSICAKLDMKRKNMLLTKAYELLEDM